MNRLIILVSAFGACTTALAGPPGTSIDGDIVIVVETGFIAFFTLGVFIYTASLARSTKRLVENTREDSKKNLRAYLSIDEHHRKRNVEFGPPNASEGQIWIAAVAKNFGNTPALKVKFGLCLKYLDTPPDKSMFPSIEFGGTATIAAGHHLTLRIEERPFDWDTYEVLLTNMGATHGAFLYAFGYASYFDVFGDQHWSRFCFRIYYKEGNLAAPAWDLCGTYNDTDDNPAD